MHDNPLMKRQLWDELITNDIFRCKAGSVKLMTTNPQQGFELRDIFSLNNTVKFIHIVADPRQVTLNLWLKQRENIGRERIAITRVNRNQNIALLFVLGLFNWFRAKTGLQINWGSHQYIFKWGTENQQSACYLIVDTCTSQLQQLKEFLLKFWLSHFQFLNYSYWHFLKPYHTFIAIKITTFLVARKLK